MEKLKKYALLFSAMGLAFWFAGFFNRELFVDNTPELRANTGEYVIWRVKNVAHRAKQFAFFWDWNKPVDQKAVANYLKDNLEPISKGVKAAEESGVSYTQYTLDNVEYIQTTFTLSNGQKVTVDTPKGQPIPPKELFE